MSVSRMRVGQVGLSGRVEVEQRCGVTEFLGGQAERVRGDDEGGKPDLALA